MIKIKSDDIVCIGANLKKYREERGLMQTEIVRELQLRGFPIQKQNYSRIEKEQEHISASILLALCEILEVSLDEIFLSNIKKQKQ